MTLDMNALETRAAALLKSGDFEGALKLYVFMADGDPSLDAGYLGWRIGTCYEGLGHVSEADYWYGRAVAENPAIEIYAKSKANLRSRMHGNRLKHLPW